MTKKVAVSQFPYTVINTKMRKMALLVCVDWSPNWIVRTNKNLVKNLRIEI